MHCQNLPSVEVGDVWKKRKGQQDAENEAGNVSIVVNPWKQAEEK